jgi:DNA-binding response OmpR family regulator
LLFLFLDKSGDKMEEHNASQLILVVEDDEKNMKLIADVLELAGYRILKAVDGEEGIAHLKVQDPDMVIADLCMPNLNGWRLGLWIMENKKHKKVPIIFLSALLNEEGLPGKGEFGDYYMPKPFEAKKLIEKIEELLTSKKVA